MIVIILVIVLCSHVKKVRIIRNISIPWVLSVHTLVIRLAGNEP